MFSQLVKLRITFFMNSIFSRVSKNGKKPSIVKKILIGLLVLYIVACLFFASGAIFFSLVVSIAGTDFAWLYWTMVSLFTVLFCFVGSVFITQQHIFNARDNELLLSMPIKPSTILLSRLVAIMGVNLGYAFFIFAPATIVYGMIAKPQFTVYVAAIIGFLLIPLLATALSCFFGYILAQVTSRMRYKNLVTIVLTCVLFLGYMYVCFNITSLTTTLIANGESIASALRQSMPPFYSFGVATTAGDILGLWQIALWCLIPFGLVFWLLKVSFISIATAKKGEARVKYTAGKLNASSPSAALTKKELKRIFGTPIYMFNCGLGSVMHILLGVVVFLKAPETLAIVSAELGGLDVAVFAVPMLCLMLCFCSMLTCTSSVSISLEGNNFWVLKSLPINARTILRSKIYANLIIGVPAVLIASILCIFAVPMTFMQKMLLLITPLMVQVFVALFGITANIWMPRFDWISEAAVVKNSGSSYTTVFGSMAVLGAPSLLFVYLFNKGITFELFASLFSIALVLVCLFLYFYSMKMGQKMMDDM